MCGAFITSPQHGKKRRLARLMGRGRWISRPAAPKGAPGKEGCLPAVSTVEAPDRRSAAAKNGARGVGFAFLGMREAKQRRQTSTVSVTGEISNVTGNQADRSDRPEANVAAGRAADIYAFMRRNPAIIDSWLDRFSVVSLGMIKPYKAECMRDGKTSKAVIACLAALISFLIFPVSCANAYWAIAYAQGRDGAWAAGKEFNRASAEEAASGALSTCRGTAQSYGINPDGCKILSSGRNGCSALAVAKNDNGYGFAGPQRSLPEANSAAIAACTANNPQGCIVPEKANFCDGANLAAESAPAPARAPAPAPGPLDQEVSLPGPRGCVDAPGLQKWRVVVIAGKASFSNLGGHVSNAGIVDDMANSHLRDHFKAHRNFGQLPPELRRHILTQSINLTKIAPYKGLLELTDREMEDKQGVRLERVGCDGKSSVPMRPTLRAGSDGPSRRGELTDP